MRVRYHPDSDGLPGQGFAPVSPRHRIGSPAGAARKCSARREYCVGRRPDPATRLRRNPPATDGYTAAHLAPITGCRRDSMSTGPTASDSGTCRLCSQIPPFRLIPDRRILASDFQRRRLCLAGRTSKSGSGEGCTADAALPRDGAVRLLGDVPRAANPQNAVIDDMTVFEGQLPAADKPGEAARVRAAELHHSGVAG